MYPGMVTRSFIFTATFDERQMWTLEEALSHCQAHCREQLAQGARAPFLALDVDIEKIRKKRYRVQPRGSRPDDLSLDAQTQLNLSRQLTYTALYFEFEMASLADALTYYQALCRKELARSPDASIWARDNDIENVRKELYCVLTADAWQEGEYP